MTDKKTKNIVGTALFMALVIISTIIIRIPTPSKGYVNLGDTLVILSSWILGPIYGMISSSLGSMIADFISGAPYYALGSLLIKGLMALISGLIFSRKNNKILSASLSELIMLLGYFTYSSLIFGDYRLALTCIPGDIIQAVISIVLSLILFHFINRKGIVR